MLDDTRRGRHRSATRYNPAAELSTIVKSAGQTSVKASAVLLASGGLVAAFALPAHATAASATAGTTSASAPQAGPAQAPRALPLAPAVVAPAAAAPVAHETLGVVGVTAVAKPKPKPKPKPHPVAVRHAVVRHAPVRHASVRQAPVHHTATRHVVAQRSAPSASRSSVRHTAPSTVKQSSSSVVNVARGLLGIPYIYGGSTPAGFDCSGFTMYVFGKAGISIPRTASAQQRAATRVSSPQPGDLVFYGSPAWHVGIYTGNGMMIDSPHTGASSSERKMFSGVTGYGRF